MKVCIDGRTIYRRSTGFGYYSYYLINNVLQINREYPVYTILHKDTANLVPDHVVENNEKILTSVDYRNRLLRDAWENIALPAILKRHEIDVFHSPTFHLPLLTTRRVKSVITIHDLVVFKIPEIYPRYYTSYWRFVIRRSLDTACKIIAISRATKLDIMDLFNIREDKIHVIYHGIDLKRFRVQKEADRLEPTLKKYGLKRPYIMTLGLSDPRKNGERILSSYSRIAGSGEAGHAGLAVCGVLRRRNQRFLDQIKALGLSNMVMLTGFVEDEDLPILYSAADLFLFPSLYEGFGLPILEAMACGTPVITSNISSMPEVAGDAALLVDPYDVDGLARAMKEVLTNKKLRGHLKKKGFERVKKFSWERCARQTLEVFNRVGSSSRNSVS